MDECFNQYGRVLKEDTSEYQRLNTDECLNQYGRVLKEDTDEYQERINTDECFNQYGRLLKEDKKEYHKVKHGLVFESIRTSIERRYRRVSKVKHR